MTSIEKPPNTSPHDMPYSVQQSAWWYSHGIGDTRAASDLFNRLEMPMHIIAYYFAFFYLVAHFASPFKLSINLATGQINQSETSLFGLFVVFIMHGLFALQFALYAARVLAMVPWKDTRCSMVACVETSYPMVWTGLHYLVFAGIAFSDSRVQSINIWFVGIEGLVLMYLHIWQPAFGFVPWKRGDDHRREDEIAERDKRILGAYKPPPIERSAPAPVERASAHPEDDITYKVPVEARQAKLKFKSIFGMAAIKDKLLAPAQAILAPLRPDGEAPRNGFLLFGEPGNGKTVFAEALAGELDIPIIVLTYGEMSSQWLGNMPKVMSNIFSYAKRNAPCVLFIDEIDSFIKSRDLPGNNSEEPKITNTMLTEIVNLRGHNVILIGATNYLAKLDAAAVREGRFDYKVEITPPDEEARLGLIQAGIKKYAIGLEVDQPQAISVAKRWNGFSVARLMAICKALQEVAKKSGHTNIGLIQWMAALREVQGRQGKLPVNTKSMSELVLESESKEALHLIASRLKDVARIESMGGTLPTGVLFHGPSGTGKTAAVRALAKEVEWAFLSVSGPDLLSDRTKLDKLFAEAKDIRPTIIFIDEADDVLRNRQYSNSPDMVNKLLTLMDGAEERVKDVVWVAATNNPDQIEPALLRGGRFTEKVKFTLPPQEQIPRHISMWMKSRGLSFDPTMDNVNAAESLQGQTIANIEGVLQYAVNSVISKTKADKAPAIGMADIENAKRIVLNTVT